MRTKDRDRKITWKNTVAEHDNFLNAYPEFKKDGKVMSVLRTISIWNLQSNLMNQKRFLELVWIQPNLTEITINAMLSVYFLTRGSKKRREQNHDLIRNLNLDNKVKLLFALNLIDNKLFSQMESYRKIRNALIHKLMNEVQLGKDIDKECAKFCKLGFELQTSLHQLLMGFVRKQP